MPHLILVNGAPGSGKSTVAAELARRRPMALCLDVDQIKHALGGWQDDPTAAGLQARRLALATCRRHLRDGHDVVLGQYLARTAFIEQLDELAQQVGATFHEVLLVLSSEALTARIQRRHASPTRPEHEVNNQLVAPADAAGLVASLADIPSLRPRTILVAADGSPTEVADRVAAAVGFAWTPCGPADGSRHGT